MISFKCHKNLNTDYNIFVTAIKNSDRLMIAVFSE